MLGESTQSARAWRWRFTETNNAYQHHSWNMSNIPVFPKARDYIVYYYASRFVCKYKIWRLRIKRTFSNKVNMFDVIVQACSVL